MIYVLKLSILIVHRLGLHQNGVEFRQQFNGAIRTSITAIYDDVRYRAALPRNLLHMHTATQPGTHAATLSAYIARANVICISAVLNMSIGKI